MVECESAYLRRKRCAKPGVAKPSLQRLSLSRLRWPLLCCSDAVFLPFTHHLRSFIYAPLRNATASLSPTVPRISCDVTSFSLFVVPSSEPSALACNVRSSQLSDGICGKADRRYTESIQRTWVNFSFTDCYMTIHLAPSRCECPAHSCVSEVMLACSHACSFLPLFSLVMEAQIKSFLIESRCG